MQPEELYEAMEPPEKTLKAAKEPLSIKVEFMRRGHDNHIIGQAKTYAQTVG